MKALLLAFALPAVLAGVAAEFDRTAQVPFATTPTTQDRYDGQTVQRFNMQGMSRDRRDVLVKVLKVSGAGCVFSWPVVLSGSVARQQLGERHRYGSVIGKLISQSFDLDIWRVGNTTVDVRVPSALWKAVLSALPGSWDVSTMIPDLQALVEETQPSPKTSFEEPGDPKHPPWDMNDILTPFHDEYHSFDDMLLFGNALVHAFPDLVTQNDLGTTEEGRPIRSWSIRAGQKKGEDDLPRYEFVVQSGQHAREWVGPSSALFLLHAIALDASHDPKGKWKELLRSYTFTVVPMINPDGYVYSHEHSRMWKKNRQEVGGLVCKGERYGEAETDG